MQVNGVTSEQNIEIINGIPVDWSKFKSKTNGKTLEKAKQGYINFCKLIKDNGHKLLSDYVNSKTKVLIDFNCGHEPHWILPNNYKNGIVCIKCAINNRARIQTSKSKEEFLKRLKDNNHKLLSDYVDNKTKVLIDFNCGHEHHWIRPSSYKNGQRCPKCSGRCPEQAKEDLVRLVKEKGHKLLSEYINNAEKVLIDFNCGHEPHWIRPCDYKNGRGCPKCVGNCPEQAKEDFINMLKANGHTLESKYENSNTKVLINFNCGHEAHWIQPYDYKNGRGCPRCSGKCPEQAKEDLINLINKNEHKLLSEYINASTKVLIDFNCGHEPNWTTPSSYKRGVRCPYCKNKGEGALYKLLLDMGYDVHTQKKYEDLKDKRCLPYDFYLPEYNLLIEFDGEHHRQDVKYTSKDMTDFKRDMAEVDSFLKLYDRQRKDKLKDSYAKANGIPLLRVEYNNSKIELDKWKKLISDKIEEIKNNKIA